MKIEEFKKVNVSQSMPPSAGGQSNINKIGKDIVKTNNELDNKYSAINYRNESLKVASSSNLSPQPHVSAYLNDHHCRIVCDGLKNGLTLKEALKLAEIPLKVFFYFLKIARLVSWKFGEDEYREIVKITKIELNINEEKIKVSEQQQTKFLKSYHYPKLRSYFLEIYNFINKIEQASIKSKEILLLSIYNSNKMNPPQGYIYLLDRLEKQSKVSFNAFDKESDALDIKIEFLKKDSKENVDRLQKLIDEIN